MKHILYCLNPGLQQFDSYKQQINLLGFLHNSDGFQRQLIWFWGFMNNGIFTPSTKELPFKLIIYEVFSDAISSIVSWRQHESIKQLIYSHDVSVI